MPNASTPVTALTIACNTRAIRKYALIVYFSDPFAQPQSFRLDITMSIDDVEEDFLGLDAHVSQFDEGLPWYTGILDQMPKDPNGRLDWLKSAHPVAASSGS